MDEPDQGKPCLVISAGTCGQASGANDIMRITKRYIVEHDLHDQIVLRVTGCLGFCEMEPFILVEPRNTVYPKPKADDVPRIIDAAINGKIIEELAFKQEKGRSIYGSVYEAPFVKNQTRTILDKNQKLDPIRILNYLRNGGYAALEKVLLKPDPDWIIDEIAKAGLRGRGGAGFPTGRKWEAARRAGNGTAQKFVVCNADEGDPGCLHGPKHFRGAIPHSIIGGNRHCRYRNRSAPKATCM